MLELTEYGIVMLARIKNVESVQIQQGERISFIFKLPEEMDKENEKRLEHQSRKRVSFKRVNEQE